MLKLNRRALLASIGALVAAPALPALAAPAKEGWSQALTTFIDGQGPGVRVISAGARVHFGGTWEMRLLIDGKEYDRLGRYKQVHDGEWEDVALHALVVLGASLGKMMQVTLEMRGEGPGHITLPTLFAHGIKA